MKTDKPLILISNDDGFAGMLVFEDNEKDIVEIDKDIICHNACTLH